MEQQCYLPGEAIGAGLEYINRNANATISRCTRRRGGMPPSCDWTDVRQAMHLELCQVFGSNYLEHLGRRLLADPTETTWDLQRQELHAAIERAVDRQYWRAAKRRQRGMGKGDIRLIGETPAPEQGTLAEIDLALDLADALDRCGPTYREVVRLRQHGASTREIGEQLGVSHQTAARMLRKVAVALGGVLER